MKYNIPAGIVSGIYKITSTDGYYYIGSTNNFKGRFSSHLSDLINNKHGNLYLQRRFNKKPQEWVFELLEESNEVELLQKEQKYLDEHINKKLCLNINSIAAKPPSREGYKHTPEAIKKIIEANKRRIYKPHSAETKKKISDAQKNWSLEKKALVSKNKSIGHLGIIPSKVTNEKRMKSLAAARLKKIQSGLSLGKRYTFCHPLHGTHYLSKKELAEKFPSCNLKGPGLSDITTGKRAYYKSWSIKL